MGYIAPLSYGAVLKRNGSHEQLFKRRYKINNDDHARQKLLELIGQNTYIDDSEPAVMCSRWFVTAAINKALQYNQLLSSLMLAFNINNADRVLHTIDEIKKECKVYEIFKTDIYIKWFDKIAKKDRKLAHIIDTRLLRLELDNWGDFKKIDGDLFEMRIHYGAGIRI